jgi:alpha-glucosidase
MIGNAIWILQINMAGVNSFWVCILCLLSLLPVRAMDVVISPDGRNKIEHKCGMVTVSRDGRVLFGPQCVELLLDKGKARVELIARNDGVAYRFVTDEDGEIIVKDEICELLFPNPYAEIWVAYNWQDRPNDLKQDKLQHGCASLYTKTTPGKFIPDGRRIAYLPLTLKFQNGTTVLFSESDLRDYAGMHLIRKSDQNRRLDAVFGKFPVREKEWKATKHYRRVRERKNYIVKTNGRRTFPWRVFAIADRPIDIVSQRIVSDLASPSIGDFSWVRPGVCAWEWWSAWHLNGVPFKPGVNTATYKAYIDFAFEYGLSWILIDEGWKNGDDLFSISPMLNIDEIVSYAKAMDVYVMLWTAWRSLDGRQEEIFSHFAKRGVKGFKIDFMERDDAAMMRFIEETLRIAAKYRLCIDLHGCAKPTGLEKTYPNLVGIEGVHGLELMKLNVARRDNFPAHDCTLPFTRAALGCVDYTPGAMQNKTRKAWAPNNTNPSSQGTRVHQMALFTFFPAPLQMMCDSPSRYRANEECARFIASVPTVWDETKGLCGEISKYAAIARRKGNVWYVAAITDWTAREIEIDTSFLGKGIWRMEEFADSSDSAIHPEKWEKQQREVKAGEKLRVRLAPGGGWTAKLTQ